MKNMLHVVMLIFVAVVCCRASELPDMVFDRHLKALSTVRHPKFQDGEPWLKARKYVRARFQEYGLRTIIEQQFNTTVGGESVTGVNIIGLAEGGDTNGPIIVVGADYDTNLVGNPLKDNGGGVACLLETIHIFLDRTYWNPYYQNYTVVFVAFDLNTREYKGDSLGKPGSYYFVHEWLQPYLTHTDKMAGSKEKEFLGAIILDSVTTYNTENKTQILREGFNETLPEADSDIRENGEKGDFLGFLYTASEEKNVIRSSFIKAFNKNRRLRPYRLQEMDVHLKLGNVRDDVMNMFNHQSHYYFWTYPDAPKPAFLLFDTDADRIDPTPGACTLHGCDVDMFLTKERKNFMTHTTNTVIATLLDLQTTTYDISEFSGKEKMEPVAVILLTVLVYITSLMFKF